MTGLSRQQREVLGLVPLSSEGCQLAYVQVQRAAITREQLILELWPTYEEHPLMLAALALVCNAHPQALWWLRPYKDAIRLVGDAVVKLLTLRAMVAVAGTIPTCELIDETA
jgi:hypothetical protein